VFVVAALLLRGPLGHVGIGAAVSIASGVQAVLLFYGLRQQLENLRVTEIGQSALRILGATLGASLASAGVSELATSLRSSPLIHGLVAIPTFVASFFLLAKVFGSPELGALAPLLSRLRGRRPGS
jgi:peptidoglycan biosynthesis protein MviN/MurJ (putative lipid II flippase)